jgi:hypothetical protein
MFRCPRNRGNSNLHSQAVYTLAQAAARTPQEAEHIQAVKPLFEALDESVLSAWVASGEDIGPKIRVSEIGEGVLRGLAQYQLARLEQQRQEDRAHSENKLKRWSILPASSLRG